MTVAAIDAGNLLPVAEVMRRTYPQAQIIIAADNDHQQGNSESGGINTGKDAAERAAISVAGWVSLPPTDYKADWNDYHQQHGLAAAWQHLKIRCTSHGERGAGEKSQTVSRGAE